MEAAADPWAPVIIPNLFGHPIVDVSGQPLASFAGPLPPAPVLLPPAPPPVLLPPPAPPENPGQLPTAVGLPPPDQVQIPPGITLLPPGPPQLLPVPLLPPEHGQVPPLPGLLPPDQGQMLATQGQPLPPQSQTPSAPSQERKTPIHRGSGTRFSGAPLWRFALRRDEQKRLQEMDNQRQGVPEGFVRHSDGMFFHPQQRIFWQSTTQKFFHYNDMTKAYSEIHQATSVEKELRLCVDASCIHRQDGVKEHRHVIIRDLVKAGQSLRMPIDHLPRPCMLLAIYDGHRPTPLSSHGTAADESLSEEPLPACAEFCARNLHLKLLARLSAFQGSPSDTQIIDALRHSCADLDADFLERSKNALDGCSAVVALFAGHRSFIAGVGTAVGLLGSEAAGQHEVSRQTAEHSLAAAAEWHRACAAGGTVMQDRQDGRPALRASHEGTEVLLRVSRAFGDRAFKATGAGGNSIVTATPDVTTAMLHHRHRFLALISSEVAGVLNDAAIADVLRRRSGRPRMACGALLQEAQKRGAVGSLTALCVFLEWRPKNEKVEEPTSTTGAPPGKKPRVEAAPAQATPKQVRCRQILVRHRDCKEPMDRVRSNKLVTRGLAEAEGILREALEAIEGSPEKSVFTQRCKAVSECSTCLKGGEMAGDLGWMSRGQAHPAIEAAAFALPVGHISDIVESDEGVHVLWRIA